MEMATEKPKVGDVIGCLFQLPAFFWEMFVQRPRACWVAKHRGRGADLHKAHLYSVSLSGVCLEGANLSEAHVNQADLSGANLTNANLFCAHLHHTNLQGASLRGAILRGAGLVGTDLQNADLTGADLTQAMLWHMHRATPPELRFELTPEQRRDAGYMPSKLAGADLTDAILIGADLIDADLSGARLTNVRADARTRWPEGFDPQQHGIEIPPMPVEWQLKRGNVVLGALQDCHPDYRSPLIWFRGHFTPTDAFEEVRPLFEEAVQLSQSHQGKEYLKRSEAISALGLRLESADGEILDLAFLHIEGKEARFRY
jgi:hypothetical protein